MFFFHIAFICMCRRFRILYLSRLIRKKYGASECEMYVKSGEDNRISQWSASHRGLVCIQSIIAYRKFQTLPQSSCAWCGIHLTLLHRARHMHAISRRPLF